MDNNDLIPLVVTDVTEVAKDVRAYTLEPKGGERVTYEAGQFLNFVFQTSAGEVRRAYSIAAGPGSNDALQIVVKRIPNGLVSRRMIDAVKAGDVLYATPPKGLFTLPKELAGFSQVFLFAAGIGITPIYSLVKTLMILESAPPVVLVYSNRSKEDAVFRKELTELQEKHPERLKIEWLYSNAPNAERARLSSVLMPKLLQEYAVGPMATALCYTCGPVSYMWMVSTLLHQYGVPLFNIRKEIFEPSTIAIKLPPPDTGVHAVIVHFRGQENTVVVGYPDTILTAAAKEKIMLPYSCRAGRCGSCVAKCIAGTVWHSYNEVLTDKDLAAGLVLTCTGHPIGDGVEICVDG